MGGKAVEFLQALTEGNNEIFSSHLQNFVLIEKKYTQALHEQGIQDIVCYPKNGS